MLGKFGNSCSAETLENPVGRCFTPGVMATCTEQTGARVQSVLSRASEIISSTARTGREGLVPVSLPEGSAEDSAEEN